MPFRRSRAVVVAVAIVILAACGAGQDRRSGEGGPVADTSGGHGAAANATSAPLLPTDAFALPAFTLGEYQRLLRQLRGTPVVVNMWGSWCPPCRQEAPLLAEAHAGFGDRIQFLGIDIEDSRDGAIAFMREFGWTFPSIVDPSLPSRFRSGLGFVGQPNTLFYDASGELVRTWQGPLTEDVLREAIAEILPS